MYYSSQTASERPVKPLLFYDVHALVKAVQFVSGQTGPTTTPANDENPIPEPVNELEYE